jgi:Domain of Unknown Function (DUF748)
MKTRRWLVLFFGVVVIAIAAALYVLPEMVRQLAIARIHALTDRPVSVDRVDLNVFTGRLGVHGFRLAERDGQTPFADVKRLDARLHLPSLLLGHLWLRELIVSDSTVRVVRLPTNEFNFSDLIRRSGRTGRTLDVTMDRFTVSGGTVTLEDQALPERRTWVSEQIEIEAHNVSTRRNDGRATGRSITGGAPVSVEVTNLRLHPVHLQATVTVEGLDLTPARVYLPPDAPVMLERGRASTAVTVTLDARDGLRADGTGRFEDVALVKREGGERLAVVPTITTQVIGFAVREGDLRLARLAVEGTMGVRDPRGKPDAPFQLSSVRAQVADLTWPATTPGQLDLHTSIPGGGTLAITGTIQPPPAPSQLRLRLANLDLAPWAQFLPLTARVTGLAEADLRMNEALAAGIPARVHGSIAVNRLGVADARQEVLAAQRVSASGLAVHWPMRVVIDRVLITAPRGTVERDRTGAFSLTELVGRPAASTAATSGSARSATAAPLGVEIGEIAVRNGAMAWRDQTVSPPARLELSGIDAKLTGLGWPLRGPVGVRAALRPPGGGQFQISGRVGLDPLSADVRVTAIHAELAPYQPYLPIAARISGVADLDVAVVVPSLEDRRATVRGAAAVSRVEVRDSQRTVLRVEQASATGLEVEWPPRIAVHRLALAQPWMLIERDDQGALPLRSLLIPSRSPTSGGGSTSAESTENGRSEGPAITVTQLSVDGGGVRIVDRAVSPAFAVDLHPASLRVEGLSTVSAKPARLDLTGRLGPGAELTVRGTLGPLGGPLRVDMNGELREFAVPRANPYLVQQAGWKTTEGRLTSTVQCRVDGDALSAKTDVRLSRLHLVRASTADGAQARIGLPLGMITALMKDKRGDITLSFPVGGRLSDPRFDFSEAIWNALRTVAVRAVTLPVSWIGRVHITPDSRIQRIEVDPVSFEPGTSDLTGEGQAQATRLTAFLEELPEVKMALTPVISSRDVTELKRRTLETSIDRVARKEGLSRETVVARLFEQAFRDRRAPDSVDEMLGALVDRAPPPASEISGLAARRLEVVRARVKQSGIDPGRLAEAKLVQQDPGSRIDLNIVEPETPRPSKVRETLQRLGVPLKEQ